MVDQCLESGDSDQTAKLAPDVEETDAESEMRRRKATERDQRDRQEEATQAKAAQQKRGHHVIRSALERGTRKHPHGDHHRKDAEGDGCNRRHAPKPDEKRHDKERRSENQATRQKQLTGLGRCDPKPRERECRDKKCAAEQRGAGNEADNKCKGEIAVAKQRKVKEWRTRPTLAICHEEESDHGNAKKLCDARLLEPVPA